MVAMRAAWEGGERSEASASVILMGIILRLAAGIAVIAALLAMVKVWWITRVWLQL